MNDNLVDVVANVVCIKDVYMKDVYGNEVLFFTEGSRYEVYAMYNPVEEFDLYTKNNLGNTHIISDSEDCYKSDFEEDEWFKEYFEFAKETV